MNRPRALAALLLGLLVLSAPAGAATLEHDGVERSYSLELPEGADRPLPTVFVLHGGGGDGARMARFSRFHESAAAAGFVTVYPDGVGRQWNDARDAMTIRENQNGENVDDVGFLIALAEKLAADGIADPKRIYVTGASNGGMMTLRLACEAAGVFAAFAPVIASLPADAETDCRPSRPAPMLIMNGTADKLIPWDGGAVAPMFPGDRGAVLSTPRTMEILAALNRCGGGSSTTPAEDLGDGIRLTVRSWQGCAAPLQLYRFEGMGHRWPEARLADLPGRLGDWLGTAPVGYPANDVIRRFLAEHALP